jgi:hypothetical protein
MKSMVFGLSLAIPLLSSPIAMGNRGAGMRTYPTNLLITRTPEGAKASCYFVQFNVKDDPPTMGKTAIYEDTLVKTPQGWKFKKRISWSTSDELSPFLAEGARAG